MAARRRNPDAPPAEPATRREDLLKFLGEAEQVMQLAATEGFAILKRDIEADNEKIARLWPRLHPGSREYDTLRLHALTNVRLLELIEDYKTNRQVALSELLKLENRADEIIADVDNRTPLEEEA